MSALAIKRLSRALTFTVSAAILAACGQGDGPESIANSPATPLPPIPQGFCDAINFETLCPTANIINFNGGATTIIDNPDKSGINTSDSVAQMQKFPDETFGGTVIDTGAPVDFGLGEAFTVKVWSQRTVPVLFKLDQQDKERVQSHSGNGMWEELCFDFSGDTAGVPNPGLTFIFDNGVLGQADSDPTSWTFYYDDIQQVASCSGGNVPTTFSAITFDDPALTYSLTGFGGAEDSTIANDPAGGTNQVAQVNRSDSAETFAGTTVSLGANDSIPDIPLNATSPQMSVRVWSAAVGVPVRLKIENALDDTVSVETEAITTMANAWETLTFDFNNQAMGTAAFNSAATYNKAIIFFNFGTGGATSGAQTYFFDDIDVGAGGGGGTPMTFSALTFDDSALTYTFRGFGGGEDASVVADPTDNSNNVAQVNRTATAETFAGTVVSTGANESIGTIPLDANNTQMTMRVYSPAVGVPVRLKIENALDDTVTVETEATTTQANTWETLTFDFANQAMGTAAFDPAAEYSKTVLFFNFGTDGATAGAQTFLFDDLDVVSSGGGGTGSGYEAISFDDAAITYTLRGFGGAEDSTVAADPDDATNNVAQVNRAATAETFAGTVVSTGANESIPVLPLDANNTQMTMRVYSPAAGVQVRLKIENSGDPTITVETEATTTVANAWETLTFDFTNEAAGTAAFNPAATYDKTVIFFNFGVDGATAGAQTYYFDDIDVAGSGGGTGGGGGGTGSGYDAISFDDAAITYTLRGFGGAEDSTVAADPDDATNNVAQVNRAATAETFAGTVVSTGANESIPVLPLDASNTQMTMRVYSPAAGVQVRLKIENSGDPTITVETEATTTVANAWETLTFDFTNEAAGTAAFNPAATYDKTVIFFNFGVDGATAGAQTFYFDDIDVAGSGGGTGGGGGSTVVDLETGTATFSDFEGGVATVVSNPEPAGINTSGFVGEMQKFAGQSFGGSTLDIGGTVTLAAGDSYLMKVRAQREVPVTLKLEPLNEERVAVHSGSGTWEELCFDFTGVSGDVTGYTLIFDNGVVGDAAGDPTTWTFQFDDIQPTSDACPTTEPAFSTLTFDDSALTYTLGDFGGAGSTLTNDPDGGSNMVVQVVRSGSADTFAGTVVSTLANESVGVIALDSTTPQMTVRVYSPAAGIPVRLKVENSGDAGVSVETEAMTTQVNAWETLTFDFTNEAAGTAAFNAASSYDKVAVFFNFGTDGATAGEQIFYFDDIAVGTGGGGSGSTYEAITFDDAALTYALRGFGGAEDSTVAADPTDSTNNVVQVNRTATAETFAGTVVSTGANESIPTLPLDASNTQMSVRVYSPVAGIQIRLKVENSADAGVSVETEATTTTANAWETLTFDFANQASGTPAFNPAATYDKAIVFFNFGVTGATAGAQTFYFDDIDVVLGSGSGGSGGSGGGGGALVTFDDSAITYTLRGFGGAEDSTVAADPAGGGNLVGQVNRSATAETFAGTVVSTGANESIPVLALDGSNSQMNVRVYSPAVGIPVRLKVENSGDPTITVETEATTTAANSWETLTFDFANEAAGTAAFNPAATYDKTAIFFNFGSEGATVGAQTFFFDDIDIGAGGV